MSVGTSSGRPQSAILVPVPEAEEVLEAWRRRHVQNGSESGVSMRCCPGGLPAHITLVVPWLAPELIAESDLKVLAEVLSGVESFDFALTTVRWFDKRVLWLDPDPSHPFVYIASKLAERFGTPPWGNEFDRMIPHLTVAMAEDGARLEASHEPLSTDLPVHCTARRVEVMIGDGSSWTTRYRHELEPAHARQG